MYQYIPICVYMYILISLFLLLSCYPLTGVPKDTSGMTKFQLQMSGQWNQQVQVLTCTLTLYMTLSTNTLQ